MLCRKTVAIDGGNSEVVECGGRYWSIVDRMICKA